MGFDLFMAVVAIVIAALLSWLIAWFFFAEPSGNARSEDRAAHTPESVISSPGTASSTIPRSLPVEQMRQTSETTSDDATKAGPISQGSRTERLRRLTRLNIVSAVCTLPVVIVAMIHMLDPTALPDWITNPWFGAILITISMFYCAAPIHHDGWPAILHQKPDLNSLICVGSAFAYIYSLAICVAGNTFPEGSREPHFEFVGLTMTLILFAKLIEYRIAPTDNDNVTTRTMRQNIAIFTHFFVPAVFIIALWAFVLLLVFGPQPRLASAVIASSAIMMLTGLALALTDVCMTLAARNNHVPQ